MPRCLLWLVLGGAVLWAVVVPRCAWAWTPGEASAWSAPGPVHAMAVGRWGDGIAVVAAGDTATWVLDAKSGKVLATVDASAPAVALADHDGDGRPDVVLCGPDGVRWARGTQTGLAALASLTSDACGAVGWFAPKAGERDLVVAGPEVRIYAVGADGALARPVDFTTLSGPPLLATAGARFAVAARGDRQVYERSEWGRSVYAARQAIGGLAHGPRSWVWSLPAANAVEDVTRDEVSVAADPTALRGADLDGDGVSEVLVLHPDAVGVLSGGTEKTYPLGAPARDLATADVDGDGCQDLLLLRAGAEVALRPGVCAAKPAEVAQRGAPPTRLVLDDTEHKVTAWVGHPLRLRLVDPKGLANRFGSHGGPAALKVDENGGLTYLPPPDDVGEWVVNVRMWGGSDVVRVVPVHLLVQPASSWIPAEHGQDHGRVVLGTDQPTVQVLVGGTLVAQMVDGIGKATRFVSRGGPPGMKLTTAGVLTYTATMSAVGEWDVDVHLSGDGTHRKSGFHLRVAPQELVGSAPGSELATAAAAAAARPRDAGFWQLRGCMVSLGVAAGLTGTSQSWAYVGQPVYFSFSPVLAGTCEGGPIRGVNWFAGGDTAPVYAYLLNGDNIGVHTLVLTAGLSFGGDRLRAGPYLAGGILMTAVGARLWWLPFVNKAGTPQGFEVRVAWVFAQTPSVEGMLMYGWRLGRLK